MAQVSVASGSRHHVQFYEDASALAEQVATYLAGALRSGGAAVAIARPLTHALIELQLGKAGLDVTALRQSGKLALLDALEALQQIMVDGAPDRDRFRSHIGGLVRRLCEAAGGREVRAYGELVDLLWADGKRAAVIALEQQWSELLRELPFSLICGYQLRAFDADLDSFERVCEHHDRVDPVQHIDATAITASRILAQLEHRARALELEVSRRTHIEQRMLELLDLTGQLAAANDRERVAQLTVENGVNVLGAIDGGLWVLAPDGSHLELLAMAHPTSRSERYRELPLSGDTPIAHVVRTGEPVFLRSLEEYAERFPASQLRTAEVLSTAHRSFALLPIAIDDHQPFGAVVFTFAQEREFTDPDRAFKTIFARQCALALARLQQRDQERALREASERAAAAEKQARGEVELLYELTASVNQLDDVDAVYDLALHTVRRGAASERAAILLFDDDGVMRFKAAHELSPAYRAAVEGHSPWQRDAQAPVAIAVDDTDADPAWAAFRDVFRSEGIRALAFVPIVHQRQLIGKFMLYRNEPRAFQPRELQFTSTVAVHVAQAIERKRNELEIARAYTEEREAHLLAEEATRAREEILSVVSHDLRNPLGTILMGATAMLTVDVGERNPRIRTIAERIHRQAERMARLIEDLVDFAGIQAGQLAIRRKPHKPEEILTATRDIFSSLAQERGLRFETRIASSLPQIDCDSERAVQVMSNLVANALKVTPRGGEIAIGAEPSDKEVVFFVHDTGPGIAAEELPKLFERYWRSKHQQYKGAGLGLSIARGIVDAHGGRIWAESRLGAGSTFYFSLATLRK